MTQPLSGRQKEVFDFIIEYRRVHKRSPSYNELSFGTSLSVNRIQQIVGALKANGLLAAKPRVIELT